MVTLAEWNSGALPTISAQNNLGTVTQVTASGATPPGLNLLTNPDFEYGSSGWETSAFAYVTADAGARSGASVMRLEVDAGNRWPLSEVIPTAAGRQYKVFAHYRIKTGAGPVDVSPLMVTWDAAGVQTLNLPSAAERTDLTGSTWTYVEHTFTAPAGAVRVAFAPWAEITAGHTVDVDDVGAYNLSAFPQTWMEFNQVANNNLAAVPSWGYDVPEATARFYYRAPMAWADGSCHFVAFQTMPGPTEFDHRINLAGEGRPGVITMSERIAGELASTNPRTMKEGRWHRFEFQYRRTGPYPIETRARLFRTGSDIAVWDTGWMDASQGNNTCAALRLGLVQDLSTGGYEPIGIAHYKIVDELTTIGRHATDTLTPPHHLFRVWDGTRMVPALSVGVWNGTSVVPATEATAL